VDIRPFVPRTERCTQSRTNGRSCIGADAIEVAYRCSIEAHAPSPYRQCDTRQATALAPSRTTTRSTTATITITITITMTETSNTTREMVKKNGHEEQESTEGSHCISWNSSIVQLFTGHSPQHQPHRCRAFDRYPPTWRYSAIYAHMLAPQPSSRGQRGGIVRKAADISPM
jgi:hypothetical protein